jgi:NDP-sugar pyrophosphorylase family protein
MKKSIRTHNVPKITVLVLAASKSFQGSKTNTFPLCLTEFSGKSVLELTVEKISRIENSEVIFAFLESDSKAFYLERISKLLVPNSVCIKVSEETKGSGCTGLFAACQLDQERELLILSANEIINLDFMKFITDFRKRKLDAGTPIFQSVHPRYSFVRLDKDDLVIETAQRQPISSNATTGIFWFNRTGDFVDAIKNLILKEAQVDDAYFIAPSFNEIILKGKKVGVFRLSPDEYFPLKTEQQANVFETKGVVYPNAK